MSSNLALTLTLAVDFFFFFLDLPLVNLCLTYGLDLIQSVTPLAFVVVSFFLEKYINATSFPHEHDQSKSAVITPVVTHEVSFVYQRIN